jgi:hypothetical protein
MSLIEKIDEYQENSNLNPFALRDLMEDLCIAESKDLQSMATYAVDKYGMEVYFWIILLTYRLAILQSPNDAELLESAGQYIQISGGPDFDYIANEYLERSQKIRI